MSGPLVRGLGLLTIAPDVPAKLARRYRLSRCQRPHVSAALRSSPSHLRRPQIRRNNEHDSSRSSADARGDATHAGRTIDGGRFAPAGRAARRRGRIRYSGESSAARLTPPIIEGEIVAEPCDVPASPSLPTGARGPAPQDWK